MELSLNCFHFILHPSSFRWRCGRCESHRAGCAARPQSLRPSVEEHAVGFEPTFDGFAARRLSTWLRVREIRQKAKAVRDSNPQPRRSKRRALVFRLS